MPEAATSSVRTHLPGDGHMWFMVLGDLFIFGGYFIAYLVFRAQAPEQFLANMKQQDCQGFSIKVSARRDGSFTITNLRNNFSKTYSK